MSRDNKRFSQTNAFDLESEATETEDMVAIMARNKRSKFAGWDRIQFSMSSDDEHDELEEEEEEGQQEEEAEYQSHLFAEYDFKLSCIRDAFAEDTVHSHYRVAPRSNIVKTLSSSLPRLLTDNKTTAARKTVLVRYNNKSCVDDRGDSVHVPKTKHSCKPKRLAPKPKPLPLPPPPPLPSPPLTDPYVPNEETSKTNTTREEKDSGVCTETFFEMFPDLCARQSDRLKQYSRSVQKFLRETQDYQVNTTDKRLRSEVGNLLQALFVVRDYIEGRKSHELSVASTSALLEPCGKATALHDVTKRGKDEEERKERDSKRTKSFSERKEEKKDKKSRSNGRAEHDETKEREKKKTKSLSDGGDVHRSASLPSPVSPIRSLKDLATVSAPHSPRRLRSPAPSPAPRRRSARSRSPRRVAKFKTRSNSDRNVLGINSASISMLRCCDGAKEETSRCASSDGGGGGGGSVKVKVISDERLSRRNSRDRFRREKRGCKVVEEQGDAGHERLVKVSEKDWKIFCRLFEEIGTMSSGK